MERVESRSENPAEVVSNWLKVNRTWRKVVGAPTIKRAEKDQRLGDDEACRRKRQHLLDADVLTIALLLYRAGKDKSFSAKELTDEIAEDNSILTMDRARKRVSRILRVMEAYGLVTMGKTDEGRIKYEIRGTPELAELLTWFVAEIQPAPEQQVRNS